MDEEHLARLRAYYASPEARAKAFEIFGRCVDRVAEMYGHIPADLAKRAQRRGLWVVDGEGMNGR